MKARSVQPEQRNDVSAIVVTFNSRTELPSCLSALRAAGVNSVIVVDNASVDGTPDLADSLGAHVIRCNGNLGFGSAVNKGIAAVDCSRVLLVNPDCRVEPGCVAALSNVLDRDPGLAAVVPSMVLADGASGFAGGPYPSILKEILAALRLDDVVPPSAKRLLARGDRLPVVGPTLSYVRPKPRSGVTRVQWVCAWCMLVRADLFRAVGGFDERFFLYFEDVDLSRRFHDLGYDVAIVAYAHALHDESSSTRRHGKRTLYAAGRLTYFATHGGTGTRVASRVLDAFARRV